MRICVTGGAGFIGSHFVKRVLAAGDEVVVLDKLTYSGNMANLDGCDVRFVRGDIVDPDAVAEAADRLRRDRQLRRGDARRPLDPRGRRLPAHERDRDERAARLCAAGGHPARPRLDGRGLRRRRARRVVPRGRSAAPLEPVLRGQGRRRPARPRARPHLRRRRAHHARLEHVRPEPVPGEDPPALRHERARRRAAPALRRRQAGARLALRRRPLRRDRARATPGRGGRGLQRRRRRGGREPRDHAPRPRADRRGRVADPPRRRPPRPRPALLPRHDEAGGPRLGQALDARGRPPRDGRWYRDNRAWWEQIKQSDDYRAYYEKQYAARLAG